MDKLLVQKWLEQGERIEKCHLDVLRKNKANNGLTDGTDSFRQIYYHFDQQDDAQIDKAIKVLNSFQRGKSSGTVGKEVVKDFLSNSLILLGSAKNREELKLYLEKNGIMPVDNSEELRRLEEKHRQEQENLRRQKEAEEKRRAAEEEERRHKLEEQQRQREIERQRREEKRRKDVEEKQRDWDILEQDIDRFTAEREQYVISKMKNKRFNIPWKSVLKVIAVITLIYMFFTIIGLIKGFVSGMRSSSNPAVEYTEDTPPVTENTQGYDPGMEDDMEGYGTYGLMSLIPEGTSTYTGTMAGEYIIELTIVNQPSKGVLTATYRNVKYGTTMEMIGESLPADDGAISFFGEENGRHWSFYLTGDPEDIRGTATNSENFETNIALRRKH